MPSTTHTIHQKLFECHFKSSDFNSAWVLGSLSNCMWWIFRRVNGGKLARSNSITEQSAEFVQNAHLWTLFFVHALWFESEICIQGWSITLKSIAKQTWLTGLLTHKFQACVELQFVLVLLIWNRVSLYTLSQVIFWMSGINWIHDNQRKRGSYKCVYPDPFGCSGGACCQRCQHFLNYVVWMRQQAERKWQAIIMLCLFRYCQIIITRIGWNKWQYVHHNACVCACMWWDLCVYEGPLAKTLLRRASHS